MKKFLLMIAAVLLLSAGTAFAAADDSGESDGDRDPLEDVTCDWVDNVYSCNCDGDAPCDALENSGLCDRNVKDTDGTDFTMNDFYCEEQESYLRGHDVCSCTADVMERITPGGTSQRPDSYSPGTDNAPPPANLRPGRPQARNFNPPSRLSVGGATSTSLTLSWRDNSNSEVGFVIEQLDHMTVATGFHVGWSTVATIRNLRGAEVTGTGPRSHTMYNLRPGTTNYCYRVRAFRGSDTSSDTTNATEVSCATTLEVVN